MALGEEGAIDLRGVWVPLVTPMRHGKLDITSLRRLCAHLLEQGITGFVPCGTTGEGPTLSLEERSEVIACVADVADRVVAGAGAISTSETFRLCRSAAMSGAEAVLVISPFFVAPTQEEILAHYEAVADASPVPVLVYNFPARTGAAVAAATTLELAGHPRIVGTKHSVPFVDAEYQRLILDAPKGFSVLAGSTDVFWPALALGAHGGVLAAAHLEAHALIELLRRVRAGDLEGARALHRETRPRWLPVEGPREIKVRLREQGLIASAEMRPPLNAET